MREAAFADTLRGLMRRPRYTATAGLASKLSGLPRATIVNWLEGRVARPRRAEDLRKLADALRFDEIETAALFAAAARPLPKALQAVLPTAPANALPAQATELIGRDDDVAAIRNHLLRRGRRLVTLVGPGGVGKTHLAIEAAAKVRDAFPDGIVWISLANLRDPTQVLPDIAQALGIHEAPERSLIASVQIVLRTARVLLVVDNFEQVVSAAGVLTDLLASTEQAKILVTSRTSMRLRGEHEFRVEPLARPPINVVPALSELDTYPAIALFIARARAVRRDFILDTSNAADVCAICERVDGLPLALELAAAQARALAPGAILARLTRPLSVLVDGPRDAVSRQRTLRQTIGWSYALLTDEHRSLFRKLAVFAGGISLDGTIAVTAGADERERALDQLRTLVDHSLLSPAFHDRGEPRFRMLATIREYAGEQLAALGEEQTARARHGEHILELAERAERLFASEPTSIWSYELLLEHDNLRAALSWYLDTGADPVMGARLVAALGRYWFERGLFLESRRWLERVVSSGILLDPATDAKLKLYLAFVANYDGDYATGASMAGAARVAYHQVADAAGQAQALNAIGVAALYTGDYSKAEEHFTTALAEYELLDERRGIAVELHNLAEIASECRFDFPGARTLFERSLEIFTTLGHTLNVAMTLGVLAECHAHAGDAEKAVRASEEALELFRTLGNQPLMAEELARLARFAVERADVDLCRSLLMEALDQLRATANPRHHARCFEGFARLAHALHRPQAAARLAGFAQRIRLEHTIPALPAAAEDYRRWAGAVREKLGMASFDLESASGADFDLATAIAQALVAVSPDS